MSSNLIKNIFIAFCSMGLMILPTQADVLYSGATSSFGRLTYTVGETGDVSVGGTSLPKSSVDPNINAVSELSMHPRFFTDWVVPGHFIEWNVPVSSGGSNNPTATRTPTPTITSSSTPTTPRTPTPTQSGNTPTRTATPTATPIVTSNEIITQIQIIDDLFSSQDLSGGEDVDSSTDKKIGLRWNFNSTVSSEVLIFVVYPNGDRRFLTHVDSGSTKELVWDDSDQFSVSPEAEIAYRFVFYVAAKTGSFSIAGPFLSNTILLHVEEQQLPNTVIVTDDTDSRINLVGRMDTDKEDNRQLVIRWNVEEINIQAVYVYVYINDANRGSLLSRVYDGSQFVVWNSANPLIQAAHQPGPQSGSRYRFDIVVLTTDGNISSPVTSGGYVQYQVERAENEKPTPTVNIRPTATRTPTMTPTPIRVIPSPTVANRPTPTLTPNRVTPTPVAVDIPVNTLIVTDDEYSKDDLSGGEDVDIYLEEKMMIRWNINATNIRNIFVYVYINDSPVQNYLGSPPAGQHYLVWEPNSTAISAALREGPQHNTSYRFEILIRSSSSNRIIGPYTHSAPVKFVVKI